MSVLTQKLHVKKNNTVYECTCYSTEEEATPKTIENGSCMDIKCGNETGYIGLWPKAVSFGNYHTPLTAKKDGVEYWVETQVNNMVNVTINQVPHQIITVVVDGVAHTTSFTAMAGAFYEINITPDPGYNAGLLNITNVGYLTSNLTVTASEATRIRYTIIISNPTGQTLSVQHNGKTRTNPGFYGYYGDTWTASVAVASGYTQGTIYPGTSGIITGNEEISVTDPTAIYYTVTLSATTNQTITLNYKQPGSNQVTIVSEGTAKTLQLKNGTTWTASIAGANGYTPGALNPGTSGTINANTTISASAAALNGYTVTLAATTNQTITFKYTEPGGSQITKTSTSSAQSFTLRHGTAWTATIAAATGYNAGTLSPGSSGTITAATKITASAATLKTYALKLNATTHQTITLKYTQPGASQVTKTSTSSAQTFTVKHGTTWTATIAGATGYNPGTLSPGSSGTVTAAVTVTASAAALKTYTLKLNATTHQTITLKYTQPGASAVTKTSTSSAQSFTVKHGTTWTASITGATGWKAGALSPGSSGTVTAATTVSAAAATFLTYTLKLAATSHQTITLKYKNHKSDGTVAAEVTKTSTSSAQSFTVGYGTTWTATLAAATGYTKGSLSASSGTVKAATTVSATAATAITPKITITKAGDAYDFTVTYTNTSGTSVTSGNRPSSVTIKYNTTIRFNANTGSSYYDLSIKQGSTYKTTIDYNHQWTSGALTANTTFTVTGVNNTPEGSSGEGSGGEGGA